MKNQIVSLLVLAAMAAVMVFGTGCAGSAVVVTPGPGCYGGGYYGGGYVAGGYNYDYNGGGCVGYSQGVTVSQMGPNYCYGSMGPGRGRR
ncbi:MAG: hypothetical protein KGJ35_01130 [Patescibacteria group bacterium]|nr:hypothetical protein [Patescibacteria group bacterium]